MDDVLELCRGREVRHVAAGEELLAQGGNSGLIFVLVDGVVAISSGGMLIKRVAEPGAFLGEISALLGIPHTARVAALTACDVYVLRSAELTAEPALLLAVSRLLAARLYAMTGYLVDLRRQYGDEQTHLGLMAEVLSELTAVRPVAVAPGSERDDVPDY